jgi:hypothetical protein
VQRSAQLTPSMVSGFTEDRILCRRLLLSMPTCIRNKGLEF